MGGQGIEGGLTRRQLLQNAGLVAVGAAAAGVAAGRVPDFLRGGVPVDAAVVLDEAGEVLYYERVLYTSTDPLSGLPINSPSLHRDAQPLFQPGQLVPADAVPGQRSLFAPAAVRNAPLEPNATVVPGTPTQRPLTPTPGITPSPTGETPSPTPTKEAEVGLKTQVDSSTPAHRSAHTLDWWDSAGAVAVTQDPQVVVTVQERYPNETVAAIINTPNGPQRRILTLSSLTEVDPDQLPISQNPPPGLEREVVQEGQAVTLVGENGWRVAKLHNSETRATGGNIVYDAELSFDPKGTNYLGGLDYLAIRTYPNSDVDTASGISLQYETGELVLVDRSFDSRSGGLRTRTYPLGISDTAIKVRVEFIDGERVVLSRLDESYPKQLIKSIQLMTPLYRIASSPWMHTSLQAKELDTTVQSLRIQTPSDIVRQDDLTTPREYRESDRLLDFVSDETKPRLALSDPEGGSYTYRVNANQVIYNNTGRLDLTGARDLNPWALEFVTRTGETRIVGFPGGGAFRAALHGLAWSPSIVLNKTVEGWTSQTRAIQYAREVDAHARLWGNTDELVVDGWIKNGVVTIAPEWVNPRVGQGQKYDFIRDVTQVTGRNIALKLPRDEPLSTSHIVNTLFPIILELRNRGVPVTNLLVYPQNSTEAQIVQLFEEADKINLNISLYGLARRPPNDRLDRVDPVRALRMVLTQPNGGYAVFDPHYQRELPGTPNPKETETVYLIEPGVGNDNLFYRYTRLYDEVLDDLKNNSACGSKTRH